MLFSSSLEASFLNANVRQGGRASWPDSRGERAYHLSCKGLVDVGDAFFVAALVQVLQRGEVGQVGLEFVTESWPDGSGIAIGRLSCQMVWSLIFVGAKEELSAEHGIVLLDRHDLGLVMKMELQCHDVTTGDGAQRSVLLPLEVFTAAITEGQSPDGGGIFDDAVTDCLVGCQEYLLAAPPASPCQLPALAGQLRT